MLFSLLLHLHLFVYVCGVRTHVCAAGIQPEARGRHWAYCLHPQCARVSGGCRNLTISLTWFLGSYFSKNSQPTEPSANPKFTYKFAGLFLLSLGLLAQPRDPSTFKVEVVGRSHS